MSAAIAEPLSLNPAQQPAPRAELLRFATAGSVDDGKSTLIGRLLYDTKGIYEDQIASIQKTAINRSGGPLDLSLVTDGLRAEREQGITIDVAYRYFSTPRRKFIIADTPGHEQYTRNMATGASNADAAVILIDATRGVLTQSRRHACIAALLGIQHVVAAINKMDLAGYREDVFAGISVEFRSLAVQLGIPNVHAIPVSALKGDNIVQASPRMPWFRSKGSAGATLLEHLENIPIKRVEHARPLRFPVQHVVRPDSSFRGFAGRVASGVLRCGDGITALPSGMKSRVKSIVTFDGELDHAGPGSSVTVTLEDEIDLSRGDLLVAQSGLPQSSTGVLAKLVWLHSGPCRTGELYLLKHGTRTVRARISKVLHRLDVNTLRPQPPSDPQMNDIVAVHVEATLPLFFDPYSQDRVTGSFILIDPITNATVAAGMIEGKSEATTRMAPAARRQDRANRNGHPPAAVWIAGRPQLAERLDRALFDKGWQAQLVSCAELPGAESPAVVSMLRRMGIVAIFSLDAGHAELQRTVAAIYGEHSFFPADGLSVSDDEACAELLRRLMHCGGVTPTQKGNQ